MCMHTCVSSTSSYIKIRCCLSLQFSLSHELCSVCIARSKPDLGQNESCILLGMHGVKTHSSESHGQVK